MSLAAKVFLINGMVDIVNGVVAFYDRGRAELYKDTPGWGFIPQQLSDTKAKVATVEWDRASHLNLGSSSY